MGSRSRYFARLIRAALRRTRWDAWTIARRAGVSRSTMARALTGDLDVSLGDYVRIADELELEVRFEPQGQLEALLIARDPGILGGTPVFVGSRVPVESVIASLEAGIGMARMRESYPWLTDLHVRAARLYTQANPREEPVRLIGAKVIATKARSPQASDSGGEKD